MDFKLMNYKQTIDLNQSKAHLKSQVIEFCRYGRL